MNFYKRHLGDIAKACAHLSQGEMGAYDLLMDWCYSNERPLPVRIPDLYRIARANTKHERANVDRVVADFFTLVEGGYTQKRVLEEIAKANAQAETNRQIARDREAKRRARIEDEESTNRSTIGQPSQTPDSRLQKEQKKKAKPSAPPTALPEPPEWIPAEAWTGFVDMRRRERHPLTVRAAELVILELGKLRTAGHEPAAVLDQSTRNGWRDVFALREPNKARQATTAYQPLPGEI